VTAESTAGPPTVLPDPVRQRVVAVAAEVLGRLEPDKVPHALRPAARFTPTKRARLAGPALATALETDADFRGRVGEVAEQALPDLAAALRDGTVPAAADPVDVAALAYLLRPDGWEAHVGRAGDRLRERVTAQEVEQAEQAVNRLTRQLDEARTALKEQAEQARGEVAEAKAEADALRRKIRDQGRVVKDAQRAAEQAAAELADERSRHATAVSNLEADLRRMRSRLADAETAVEAVKRAAREGRNVEDTRLWLLLQTILDAAQGLRRELALTPTDDRPADLVASAAAGTREARPGSFVEEPAQLDQLLGLPRVHLVVDGYNVTKTGYGDLTLEAQRSRLVSGLGGLAAQTGAEVTVVFDGAERLPVAPNAPRGVRVLFSRRGQTADELIRALVRAEPPGRPIVVVSSDKEVADGVRRHGAYPATSAALVRRLDRG
jgi:predicted RNA-binding protein with PIN domain